MLSGENTTFIIELFEKLMIRTEVLPFDLASRLVSRIKVMANLDISECRKAQDGSFLFEPRLLNLSMDGVNVRVSILPVTNGEKAVLRLLPPMTRSLTWTA